LGCAVGAAHRLRGGVAGGDDLDKSWLRITQVIFCLCRFCPEERR
jgi:hypothetical protein